jgi:hypothetical protein
MVSFPHIKKSKQNYRKNKNKLPKFNHGLMITEEEFDRAQVILGKKINPNPKNMIFGILFF